MSNQHEAKFSQIKEDLSRLIDEIANDPALAAEAPPSSPCLTWPMAASDYGYALSTRIEGYITDKRTKVQRFVKKVLDQ